MFVNLRGPEVLVLLLVIGLLLWFLVIRPSRRRKSISPRGPSNTLTGPLGLSGTHNNGPHYEEGPTRVETGGLDITNVYSDAQQQRTTPPNGGLPPEAPYRGLAAGFYIDPLDPSRERYWDGAHWNDETDPRGAKTRPAPRST